MKFGIYVSIGSLTSVGTLELIKNSKWPPAEVKVYIETLWEMTFSSSSLRTTEQNLTKLCTDVPNKVLH